MVIILIDETADADHTETADVVAMTTISETVEDVADRFGSVLAR